MSVVDVEVIKVYMEVTHIEDVVRARKEVEALQRAFGRKLVPEDFEIYTQKIKALTGAVQGLNRSVTTAIGDIAKLTGVTKQLMIDSRNPRVAHQDAIAIKADEDRRHFAKITGSTYRGLPAGNTLVNPTAHAIEQNAYEAYLRGRQGGQRLFTPGAVQHEPVLNPSGQLARLLAIAPTAKAVERKINKIVHFGEDQDLILLRDLNILQRYVYTEGRKSLAAIRINPANVPGVEARMLSSIVAQAGTSAYGITPGMAARGTAFTRVLGSRVPIPGGVGTYITFHPNQAEEQAKLKWNDYSGEFDIHNPNFRKSVKNPYEGMTRPYRFGDHPYDTPGPTYQQISQNIEALKKAGVMQSYLSLPEEIPPWVKAMPANEMLSFLMSTSGKKLHTLTPFGDTLFNQMGFPANEGYALQNPRLGISRLNQVYKGTISHHDIIPKFIPPRKKKKTFDDSAFSTFDRGPMQPDYEEAEYIRYGGELFPITGPMRDILGQIYGARKEEGDQGGFSDKIFNPAWLSAKKYATTGVAGLSDKSNIDRDRYITAKGMVAYLLSGNLTSSTELITGAAPFGKYNLNTDLGRQRHYSDMLSYVTGPYARQGVGSKSDAALMAGVAGDAILGGTKAGEYGPEEVVKLGESLAKFAFKLDPKFMSGRASNDSRAMLITALGGMQKIQAIDNAIQKALDVMSSKFDDYDSILANIGIAEMVYEPGEKANRHLNNMVNMLMVDLHKAGRIEDPKERAAKEYAINDKLTKVNARLAGFPIIESRTNESFLEEDKDIDKGDRGFLKATKEIHGRVYRPEEPSGIFDWQHPWKKVKGEESKGGMSPWDELADLELILPHRNKRGGAIADIKQRVDEAMSRGDYDNPVFAEMKELLAQEKQDREGQALRPMQEIESEHTRRVYEATLGLGEAGVSGGGASTPPSRILTHLTKLLEVTKKIATADQLKALIPMGIIIGMGAVLAHGGIPGMEGILGGLGAMGLPFMIGSVIEGDTLRNQKIEEELKAVEDAKRTQLLPEYTPEQQNKPGFQTELYNRIRAETTSERQSIYAKYPKDWEEANAGLPEETGRDSIIASIDMLSRGKPSNIYVDMDGVVFDNSHDLEFKKRIAEQGFEEAVKWYDSTENDQLSLNKPLLDALATAKGKGHKIIGSTNRGIAQEGMTFRNLGDMKNIFDEFIFHTGGKNKGEAPEGIVIDNEEEHLRGTQGNIHLKYGEPDLGVRFPEMEPQEAPSFTNPEGAPAGGAPGGGGEGGGEPPKEYPRNSIEKALVSGLLNTKKEAKRVKIRGMMKFYQTQMVEAQSFYDRLSQAGIKATWLGGQRVGLGGTAAMEQISFNEEMDIGNARGSAETIGSIMDDPEYAKAIAREATIKGMTPKDIASKKKANMQYTFGRDAGVINSTKITGQVTGQKDAIEALSKELEALGGAYSSATTHNVEYTAETGTATGSTLKFSSTIGETGDAIKQRIGDMTASATTGFVGQISMVEKYSSTIDLMSQKWQKFVGFGKEIKGLSRGMLQLQMGFLGVYFSMMSVVGMLQQGIGAITNPLKDLGGMIESFTLSNAFASKGALTGNQILKDYGLTLGDIVEGWKKMTWLSSTINMELGAFGAKIFGDPETWKKVEDAMMSLHNFLSDPSTIEKMKNIIKGMADMMPSLVSALDGVLNVLNMVIDACKILDQIKLPEFMSGLIGEGPVIEGTGEKDEQGNVIPGTEKHAAPSLFQGVSVVALTSGLLLGLASIVALPFTLIKLIYGTVLWIATKLGYGAAGEIAKDVGKKVSEKAGQSTLETFGEGAAGAGIASKLPMWALPLMKYSQQVAMPVAQYAPIVPAMMMTQGPDESDEEYQARTGYKVPEGGRKKEVTPEVPAEGYTFGIRNDWLQGVSRMFGIGSQQATPPPTTPANEKPTVITTNVTNIIYGDYIQSTNDKVADTINQTIKSIFVSGSVT